MEVRMNSKQRCAKVAQSLIKEGMIVGLGGGQTIQYLIEEIKEKNRNLKIVTPSAKTAMLCMQKGMDVVPLQWIHSLDMAFDGCDEVYAQFCALKSGGGIHTLEKITASMAKEYILMVDETKYAQTLKYTHPIVLEVLPEAYSFICERLKALNFIFSYRQTNKKDGFLFSEHGNVLIDVYLSSYIDPKTLYDLLKSITGVVEVSLFVKEVTGILLAREDKVEFLKK